jgi:sugar phosphate isomerase/epimerase
MLYGAMNFPAKPILEELKAAAELGFDYLELAMDPPQAHHEVVRKQKKALSKALESAGMKLLCHLPIFVNPADPTPSIREASLNEVLESLAVAAELQSLKVVLHPSHFKGPGLWAIDQLRENARTSLEIIIQKADELGICVCIENLFPQLNSLTEPDDFIGIFKRFPNLKMTLDIGHANIRNGEGNRNIQFIDRFPDRIGHIHASDNSGNGDDHLPIGTGTVDFPKIVEALRGIGYQETVTFEVFSRDKDYLKISREKFAAMYGQLT